MALRHHSGVFIVSFEHISHIHLVFLLLTLNSYLPGWDELAKLINEMLVSYIEYQRKELGLQNDSPELPILNVFRVQMTQKVALLLAWGNILFVKVLNNMTHLLQLIVLSVNS